MASHGNTPAAWTAVAVAMVGFLIGSIALMRDPVNQTWFFVGLVFCLIALPVFLVMSRMGYNSSDH